MNDRKSNLKRFERRVRLVRSWKGLAIGACFGSLAAGVWAGLDWANLAYAEWSNLGFVVAAGALLGLALGFFQKVSASGLADSIDRRAHLEERLVTSVERAGSHTGFDDALHQDAQTHLEGLKPGTLYPVRLGRWQATAVAMAALASAIFLLGNTPVLMSDQQKRDREEIQKSAGLVVERVLKPSEQHPDDPKTEAEDKKLEEALKRLAKELEKAHLTKEEAMQKTNELQKQAQELVKNRATKAEESIAKAESAFEKLQKAEMEKAGIKDMDSSLAKLSDAERQSKMDDVQKQAQTNQQKLNQLQQQLAQPNGLSKQEQMQLSKELQDLMKKQQDLAQQLEQLKLSKNVQDMLKRMMENPLYKKLLEMQRKLEDAMKDAQQNGQQQKLSHEDIERMQKELEELAKKLGDDKAMSDYLQALIDAAKQGCGT